MRYDFQIQAKTPFKMTLDLDRAHLTERVILESAEQGMLHDADAAWVMIRGIEPGDLVVDVGAHSGYFSVMMGYLAGPSGHVIAFEPETGNASRLAANVALNRLNVTLIEQAAADVAGTREFYIHSANDGGHALWDVSVYTQTDADRASGKSPVPETRKVATTTLDDELSKFAPRTPKLVKIDVEGAEHLVLTGALKHLAARLIPLLIVELHDFALESMQTSQMALREFMRGFGYETFCLYDDGQLPKLIPAGVKIIPSRVSNLLFATIETVAALWRQEVFDPAATSKFSRLIASGNR